MQFDNFTDFYAYYLTQHRNRTSRRLHVIGTAIAGGFFLHDFDGNGFFDLAVGAPQERVGAEQSAGLVSVFYASGGGVFGASESFSQDSPGLGGSSEAFDFFGAALE